MKPKIGQRWPGTAEYPIWDKNGTTFLSQKSSNWSPQFPDVYRLLLKEEGKLHKTKLGLIFFIIVLFLSLNNVSGAGLILISFFHVLLLKRFLYHLPKLHTYVKQI